MKFCMHPTARLLVAICLVSSLTMAAPVRAAEPPAGAAASSPVSGIPLTADQIIDRAIEAHGGQERWNGIRSLAWVGHIESDRLGDQKVQFSLEEVLPNKSRFDIIGSHPSERIFNGSKGWTIHHSDEGLPKVDSFSPLDERFAKEAPGLGGPLISWRRQERPVMLVGKDRIDGHDCYRLAIRQASGGTQTVWVDSQTFLELRLDRPTYNRDGSPGMVSVYFREYKTESGLQVPTVMEIGGGGDHRPDRLVIERLAVNPEISEARFAKPPSVPHRPEITLQPDFPAAGSPPHR